MLSSVRTATLPIFRSNGVARMEAMDCVALEEPLEIQLRYRQGRWKVNRKISVTMRTPGDDEELAAGFLVAEGIIHRREHLVRFIRDEAETNRLTVELADDVQVDTARLERHFAISSSCGVCGKTSIDAVESALGGRPVFAGDGRQLDAAMIHSLPERLHAAQAVFKETGGLHAAGLFDEFGELLALREDVGRHNAVDKALGARWLSEKRAGEVLFVSGRAGFELMQKAVAHGVTTLAAVGAPSSLAVELARRFNATLIGFVRDHRFNIYAGAHRVANPS